MRVQLALLCTLAATVVACSDDPITPPRPDSGPVVVVPVPASIVQFAASSTRARSGDAVILSYEVGTATAVVVTRIHAGAPLVLYAGPAPIGRLDSGPIVEATTFEIHAWGNGGAPSRTLVVDVDVPQVVIRSFTASPDPAGLGAVVTVRWDVDGATRVRVLDDEMLALVDTSTQPSGALRLNAVTGLRKLVLEAQNPWSTVTQALELHTLEPAMILAFGADPPTFGGASSIVRLSWDTRGERVSIDANGVTVPGVSPQAVRGTVDLRIAQPTVLELRSEGLGDSAQLRRIVTPDAVLELEPNEAQTNATPMTGGAVGRLDGSFDIDTFRVRVPAAAQLFVQLTDPRGACLEGVNVRLVDPLGRTVLQQSASGRDPCVFIDPRDDERVRALAGGDYFLVLSSNTLARYAIAVLAQPATCGNGILERGAGEECDDGATQSGDGCSSTCTAEVLDTFTLPGPVALRSGSIAAGQLDYYRLVVTQPVMATLETGVPEVGRCDVPGADTVLSVVDGRGEVVGLSDDEVGLCAAFGAREPLSLGVGSYLVELRAFDARGVIAAYELRVAGAELRCGDDLVAGGEACDDGNTVGGDGCAADCSAVEVLPTPATLVLDLPVGAARVVDVEVTQAGQSITATTSDGAGGCAVDTRLVLARGGRFLGYVSNGRGCATIDPRRDVFASNLDVGTYRITVVNEGATGGAVTLDVSLTDPSCGNGILESRVQETCDDGNLVDDDGCSATCQSQFGGTVTGPGGAPTVLNGVVGANGVPQVFGLVLNAGGYLFVDVGIPAIGQCTPGNDSVVEVYNSAMALVVSNDDAFGLCSVIDPRRDPAAHLTAGSYTLVVRSFNNISAIPVLQTRVELRAEGCGNEFVEAGETCDDGNTRPGDGCSAACVIEP